MSGQEDAITKTHRTTEHSSPYPPRICQLPVEILVNIFKYVSTGDGRECLNLTHVCQEWRHLALNYPGFWTCPDFEYPQLAVEMLKRAGKLPLEIQILYEVYEKGLWKMLSEPLEEVVQRSTNIRHLDLHLGCSSRVSQWLLHSLQTLQTPLLESFSLFTPIYLKEDEIEQDDRIVPDDTPITEVPSILAPNLKCLEIVESAFPFSPQPFERLTHIHMHHPVPRITVSSLLKLLEATPQLESLSLIDSFPDSVGPLTLEDNFTPRPIELPHLRALHLWEKCAIEATILILRWVAMPALSHLDIDLYGGGLATTRPWDNLKPSHARDLLEAISHVTSHCKVYHLPQTLHVLKAGRSLEIILTSDLDSEHYIYEQGFQGSDGLGYIRLHLGLEPGIHERFLQQVQQRIPLSLVTTVIARLQHGWHIILSLPSLSEIVTEGNIGTCHFILELHDMLSQSAMPLSRLSSLTFIRVDLYESGNLPTTQRIYEALPTILPRPVESTLNILRVSFVDCVVPHKWLSKVKKDFYNIEFTVEGPTYDTDEDYNSEEEDDQDKSFTYRKRPDSSRCSGGTDYSSSTGSDFSSTDGDDGTESDVGPSGHRYWG